MYIYMYILGQCGFKMPVRFWFRLVLIVKTAVSVFSVRFLINNCFRCGRFL